MDMKRGRQPVKLTVEICLGTSCHRLGSQRLVDSLDQLTPEYRQLVAVRGVTCLRCCGKGPSIRLNGIVLSDMTAERLLAIIRDNCRPFIGAKES